MVSKYVYLTLMATFSVKTQRDKNTELHVFLIRQWMWRVANLTLFPLYPWQPLVKKLSMSLRRFGEYNNYVVCSFVCLFTLYSNAAVEQMR